MGENQVQHYRTGGEWEKSGPSVWDKGDNGIKAGPSVWDKGDNGSKSGPSVWDKGDNGGNQVRQYRTGG